MRLLRTITALILCAASAAPCLAQGLQLEKIHFADSSKYTVVTLDAELPKAVSNSCNAIRLDLISTLKMEFFNARILFDGIYNTPDINSIKALKEYFDGTLKAIDAVAKQEKPPYMPYMAIVTLQKTYETKRLVVFHSNTYGYYGGLHGRNLGQGYLTYDKQSGERIVNILVDGCTEALQPLIRKGLCEYFSLDGTAVTDNNLNNELLPDLKIIPLPVYEPCPTKDGLYFEYMEYEIAPYAMGSPSFIVPYDIISGFLSSKAASIIIATDRNEN